MAFARSTALGNSVTMMATITEEDSAPPMPWTKRAVDEHGLAVGRAAGDGRQGEQRDAGQEHLLAADEVAEAPGHEQEAPEADEVGVDDPGQAGLGEVQAALDVRERHVDDGAVERVHEHGQADDDQGDPAPAVAGGVVGAEEGAASFRRRG